MAVLDEQTRLIALAAKGKTMKTRIISVTEWYCEQCEEWLRSNSTITCEACRKEMCNLHGDYHSDEVDLCNKCFDECRVAESVKGK